MHTVCDVVPRGGVSTYTFPHPFSPFLLRVSSVPGTVLEPGAGEQNGTDFVLGHLTEEVGI